LVTAGNAYFNARQNAKAREMFSQAIELYRQRADKTNEMRTMIRVGYTFESDKDYAQALAEFQTALNLARELNAPNVPELLDKMGENHRLVGEYQKALEAHREALAIYQAQNKTDAVKRTQGYIDRLAPDLEKAKGAPAPSPDPTPTPSPTPPRAAL
jgi:tetratricopeptide (TPR) repeat protein